MSALRVFPYDLMMLFYVAKKIFYCKNVAATPSPVWILASYFYFQHTVSVVHCFVVVISTKEYLFAWMGERSKETIYFIAMCLQFTEGTTVCAFWDECSRFQKV